MNEYRIVESRNTVIENTHEIPVIKDVDVIVAGGGTAGVGTAVAAARNGAKTLLIEENSFLGGTMTGVMMSQIGRCTPGISGITKELVDRMKKQGGAIAETIIVFDPETCKDVCLDLLADSGAELLLFSKIVAPIVIESQIKGIIIESKAGRQAILGQVVVDCTGDADLAVSAGVPYVRGREKDSKMRPISLLFRMGNVDLDKLVESVKQNPDNFQRDYQSNVIDPENKLVRVVGFFDEVREARERGEVDRECHYIRIETVFVDRKTVLINTTRVYNIDALDPISLTQGTLEARKQVRQLVTLLKERIPGFEDSFLMDTAPFVGVRETRRVRGDYILTEEDIAIGKEFSDSIGMNYMRHVPGNPLHSPDGKEGAEKDQNAREIIAPLHSHGIPFRCLVPQGIEGLLVGGRCISVSHEADDWTRNIPACILTGQAAGTAASLACKDRVQPRNIDIAKLQTLLSEQGVDVKG